MDAQRQIFNYKIKIMTARLKAKELVDKYHKIHAINNYEVKQCAIIAVDELINEAVYEKQYNYWQDVKQEINNL